MHATCPQRTFFSTKKALFAVGTLIVPPPHDHIGVIGLSAAQQPAVSQDHVNNNKAPPLSPTCTAQLARQHHRLPRGNTTNNKKPVDNNSDSNSIEDQPAAGSGSSSSSSSNESNNNDDDNNDRDNKDNDFKNYFSPGHIYCIKTLCAPCGIVIAWAVGRGLA